MSGPTQEEAGEFLGLTAELLTLVFADDLFEDARRLTDEPAG